MKNERGTDCIMKKRFVLATICALQLGLMTACSLHSHTETGNWNMDVTQHWKVCDECGEKTQVGKHTFDEAARCTECNSEVYEWGETVGVYTYDEYENIIRMAEYDMEGVLLSEIVNVYEYDDDGNMMSAKEYFDGELSCETEYYVSDDISSRSIQYYGDGSKSVTENDQFGNCVLLVSYDVDGNEDMRAVSEFAENSEGGWYENACTETYSDGTKIEAEYNEYGANIARVLYDADGNITAEESWEYEYDADGNVTLVKEYLNDKLVEESIYKLLVEADGTMNYPETVTTYEEDGGKTVCVYNENDDLLSETKYDASGNVIE